MAERLQCQISTACDCCDAVCGSCLSFPCACGRESSAVQDRWCRSTGPEGRPCRQAREAHELSVARRYGRLGRGNGPLADSTSYCGVSLQEDLLRPHQET